MQFEERLKLLEKQIEILMQANKERENFHKLFINSLDYQRCPVCEQEYNVIRDSDDFNMIVFCDNPKCSKYQKKIKLTPETRFALSYLKGCLT